MQRKSHVWGDVFCLHSSLFFSLCFFFWHKVNRTGSRAKDFSRHDTQQSALPSWCRKAKSHLLCHPFQSGKSHSLTLSPNTAAGGGIDANLGGKLQVMGHWPQFSEAAQFPPLLQMGTLSLGTVYPGTGDRTGRSSISLRSRSPHQKLLRGHLCVGWASWPICSSWDTVPEPYSFVGAIF